MSIPSARTYNEEVLNPKRLRELAQVTAHRIKRFRETRGNFDAIAVRGVSGITVGAAVSVLVELPLVIVRKPYEQTHGAPVESSAYNLETYAILDDCISSGNTIDTIFAACGPGLRAIFLYRPADLTAPWETRWGVPIIAPLF